MKRTVYTALVLRSEPFRLATSKAPLLGVPMLGNHADMFMNTPMPTAITTQEQQAMNMEMPAPRPTSRVGVDDSSFMPGFGQYVSAPAYSGTAGLGALGNPTNLLLIGGGLVAAYMLFFRKGGMDDVRPASRAGARRK